MRPGGRPRPGARRPARTPWADRSCARRAARRCADRPPRPAARRCGRSRGPAPGLAEALDDHQLAGLGTQAVGGPHAQLASTATAGRPHAQTVAGALELADEAGRLRRQHAHHMGLVAPSPRRLRRARMRSPTPGARPRSDVTTMAGAAAPLGRVHGPRQQLAVGRRCRSPRARRPAAARHRRGDAAQAAHRARRPRPRDRAASA